MLIPSARQQKRRPWLAPLDPADDWSIKRVPLEHEAEHVRKAARIVEVVPGL